MTEMQEILFNGGMSQVDTWILELGAIMWLLAMTVPSIIATIWVLATERRRTPTGLLRPATVPPARARPVRSKEDRRRAA